MASKEPKATASKKWEAKLSHKIRHTVFTVLVTLLIIGGSTFVYQYFTNDVAASIQHSPGVGTTKIIASPTAQNLQFTEEYFSFKLPSDWKKTGQLTTGPHRKYSYQATLKYADNRYLDVYFDQLPLNMAVNKTVAVRGEGATLTYGQVSDNCMSFTNKPSASAIQAPAKWDGVDFICDMDAITKNVVGTSSPGNINKVELVSPGFTKHHLFLVYTDHNHSPDYQIFYDFLNSFKLN